MSATCLCRSVVVSVNIFWLSVFVCELTFGQLSVGELSHNEFSMLLSSADFLQNFFFFKIFIQEHYQHVKTVWIQIRTNVLSVLIWVQTVSKGYHHSSDLDGRSGS